MPQFEVTIKVTAAFGHLNFTYNPSVLHACAGDTVVWTCVDGPFAVEFKEDTPGPDIGTHGNQVGGHWESAQFQIQPGRRGHFHYAVAVALNSESIDQEVRGQVAMDAACPEIIVN
jgi:plastocyanin